MTREATPEETAEAPAESDESVASLVERAEAASALGDHATAVDAYRAAYARQPWNEALRRRLAVALSRRAEASFGRGGISGVRAAETDLREAVELDPDDAELRTSLGTVIADLGVRSIDPEQRAALFSEAASLGVTPEVPDRDPARERRLDLAMELLSRGQLEAGIERLESLRHDYPDDVEIAVLLSRANARLAAGLEDSSNFPGAAEAYEASLLALAGVDAERLPEGELRRAHHSRIVGWLNANRSDLAVSALREARTEGVEFPELATTLDP